MRKFGKINGGEYLKVEDVSGLSEELSGKAEKSRGVPSGAVVMWPEAQKIPEGWKAYDAGAAFKALLPKGLTLIQKT